MASYQSIENQVKTLQLSYNIMWVGADVAGIGLIAYGIYKNDWILIGSGAIIVIGSGGHWLNIF
jgi:hypothetical protein